MRIGILSDTHDEGTNIRAAVEYFNHLETAVVFFAGDLATPSALFHFQGLACPVQAVYGNNEGDYTRIAERIARIGLDWHYDHKEGTFLEITYDGVHFGMYHGNSPQISEALVRCGLYDVVITGHNHQPQVKKAGKTLWINPGTCGNYRDAHFVHDPTVATYDTEKRTAEIIHLKDVT